MPDQHKRTRRQFTPEFKPDLVYGDGSRANMDTGPMLHHMVLTSQFRRDATCGSTLLGLAGERFFGLFSPICG
jgi:hypothetical protein